MKMNKKITCILCPVGCIIDVQYSQDQIINISGNDCPRGKAYAASECTAPVRTLTTTVRLKDGGLLPVKSAKPVQKDKIMEYAEILRNIVIKPPVAIGSVVLGNIGGSGIDIIAVRNSDV